MDVKDSGNRAAMDVLRTVVAVLASLALIIALSSMTAGDGQPAGLAETLGFISVAGAAFGAVVSQALEDAGWFQELSSFWREMVVKIISFGLPALAGLAQQFLPDPVPAPLDQAWVLAVLAIMMFLGSQVYHAAVNRGRTYTA